MQTIKPDYAEDPLALLARCDGYYECPHATNGKRLGPLVGYAGRYEDANKGKLQFVGDVYANFAKAEIHGPVLRYFTQLLGDKMRRYAGRYFPKESLGFCGMPEGGKKLSTELSCYLEAQGIFPEKEEVKTKTETSRAIDKLVFKRNQPDPDCAYWIVEDVCNNFSTTMEAANLIESYNARVVGIVSFLNRSPRITTEFALDSGLVVPVVSLVHKPYPEYRQDDHEVAEDVANGNVAWKPKDDWQRLKDAMSRHQS